MRTRHLEPDPPSHLNRRFTAAIPPQTKKGEHYVAALIVALALAGSAGVASAATTASSGSWFGYMEQVMMACVSGNPVVCLAAGGGPSGVITDGDPVPVIKNN